MNNLSNKLRNYDFKIPSHLIAAVPRTWINFIEECFNDLKDVE